MSTLYAPYKSIGYVCDENSFQLKKHGNELFLTSSIGSSFIIYRFNKLTPCLVSKSANQKISCIESLEKLTFIASGNKILIFDRTQPIDTLQFHENEIIGLLVIGNHLISYDNGNNIMVTDVKSKQVISRINCLNSSQISKLVHPNSYVNKILVGFENGSLELWNINKKKLIFSFSSHIDYLKNKFHEKISQESKLSSDSNLYSIISIEQSPAFDVIALGFRSGHILLLNLKLDRVLFSFQQIDGPVTSISFRTDSSADKFPHMVTSSTEGRIHVWDLGNKKNGPTEFSDAMKLKISRRHFYTIEEAHKGKISKIEFVHGEPILVSSGSEDNSIKVWIFDAPDGSPRLLRKREGHIGHPLKIRYYGGVTNASMKDDADATSCEIISAGSDGMVRLFNTALESQNRELSQKPILKKLGSLRRHQRLPECLSFDYNETRQNDWGSLVTIHKNHSNTYVWNFKNRVITETILKQPDWNVDSRKTLVDRKRFATSVCLSPCGNFCNVGYHGGMIYSYNIQSGHSRAKFPKQRVEDSKKRKIDKLSKIPGNVYHEMKKFSEETGELKASSDEIDSDPREEELGMFHTSEVTGLFNNAIGTQLVSCGLDGKVIFWDFLEQRALHCIDLKCGQIFLHGFRDGEFVAFVGLDRAIRVFDSTNYRLIRRFIGGHEREITDLAFTSDGRRLLSSSLDATIRVWDLPTGRCLSWLKFDSPITSMTISHSGEFLSLSQIGKEGIFMYIDRSLYETVNFSSEPKEPLIISDSSMQVIESFPEEHDDTSAINHIRPENTEIDTFTTQIDQNKDRDLLNEEDCCQKEGGAITLSNIPKAYWITLFHLEVIKAKNKPKLPPSKPPQAPFFLPTIHSGGATPSFPTPVEYEKMKKEVSQSEGLQSNLQNQEPNFTSNELDQDNDQKIAQELALMGSKWEDDDQERGTGSEGVDWFIDKGSLPNEEEEHAQSDLDTTVTQQQTSLRQSSRILKNAKSGLKQAPRCKIAIYLENEETKLPLFKRLVNLLPTEDEVTGDEWLLRVADNLQNQESKGSFSPLLEYLKNLPPPAFDAELRALYLHEEDAEGLRYLQRWLLWLAAQISFGAQFEILQAYLNRTIVVYSESMEQLPELVSVVRALRTANESNSLKFRNLLEKNMCILKMLAKVPFF